MKGEGWGRGEAGGGAVERGVEEEWQVKEKRDGTRQKRGW